ncbi:GNAT family N-acetyltransferase [Paenibacillus sp. TRM 82003]|nr:GNAT family N-acetyltransferase [Kineococcus sp. TRM81007]MCI2238010.1 GNAT family N-acetyltransferase [Kineococcus sp. TRM81007]MCI3926024.1 GNAT family N-acetyltransferase [Paenibacillus sp. TRM 82003]
MLSDARMREVAQRLLRVPGIEAVTLGGSRARGEHSPGSDVDLGLYYRPPLDVAALGRLAREVAGPHARVTAPGGWGPWVDGGGWLSVDGTAVDWIYRDLDRVQRSWRQAQEGGLTWHVQTGHPLGFPGFAYAGEAASAVVLADSTGELTALHRAAQAYPPRLREAVVASLGEAAFLIGGARKAAPRGDTAYVAGCLFRALLLCAHALHAHAGRWVVNEKGAVAAAGRLPGAPERFAERVDAALTSLGGGPAGLVAALDAAQRIVDDTGRCCRNGPDAVQRASVEQWPVVRGVRLRALADAPQAFGSTLAREEVLDDGTWRRRVEDGDWFLAWSAGRAVGVAALVPVESVPPAGERELVSVWVDPGHRGGGTAGRLVEAACDRAAAQGAATVSLWVADGNPRARRFYERLGFRPTGERKPLPRSPDVGEERLRRAAAPG